MKRKVLTIISILIVATLTACGGGPAPTPTLDMAAIQNAALTQAWVAMTQTQAALPTLTATPIPPTSTPFPTLAVSLPTLSLQPAGPTVAVAPAAGATTDPCNQVPPVKPQGTLVNVLFENKSGGQVNLSFGMNTPNDKGECVTYSFSLGSTQSLQATVLAGCYWAYGWVAKNPPTTTRNPTPLCVDDPSKTPPIWIEAEVVYLH